MLEADPYAFLEQDPHALTYDRYAFYTGVLDSPDSGILPETLPLVLEFDHELSLIKRRTDKATEEWIQKAYEASQEGALVVCLLPARTDTKWFHEYCTKGDIEFIKGRLYFNDGKGRAPFPSMIVVFNAST